MEVTAISHPFHHALSSATKWGGSVDDYLPIHDWFDATKSQMADFRHRALRHHAEGIFLCEQVFGTTITLAEVTKDGRPVRIPTRWVAEQHVKEDFGGRIPAAVDWLRCIAPERWMAPKVSLEASVD